MTAIIVPFSGRSTLSAQENHVSFVETAQSYRFFSGPHAVQWVHNSWDLRPFYSKATSTPVGLMAHFTNLETTRRGSRAKDAVDMREPFLTTAKAITVEHLRTSAEKSVSKIVATLRALEKALRDRGAEPDVRKLDAGILDDAEQIIAQNYEDSFTYGRLLERVVNDYINPARITRFPLTWRTSLKYKPPVRNDRVNQEGARGNTGKLPQLGAIFDLASVFQGSDEAPDVVITGWFGLAMFAPSRCGEILGLPVKCETEQEGVYGISWRPLKGGDPMTKFAASDESAEVAKLAIRRLADLGKKARTAHAWYESHPGQLYLPPGFEHLRGQPLTLWEASQILGRTTPLSQGSAPRRALLPAGTTRDIQRGGPNAKNRFQWLFTFESLQAYVLGALPSTFPFIDPRNELLGSEALFCLPDEIMRGYGGTNDYIPRYLTYAQVRHELGSKPTGKTIFSRHDLIDKATGKPWRLNTHQPRHLLNTIAQSKHISDELIAFWSGRKDVGQNASYNNLSQEFFIEAYVTLDDQTASELKIIGPLETKVTERMRQESLSMRDALKLELGSTITTRFGLCRHHFSLMGCPKDKDCISCGEITFIKGNADHLNEARLQLEISSKAEGQALCAVKAGRYGAQRFAARHGEKAARWKFVIEKLTDDALPHGTLITLAPVDRPQTRAGLATAIRAAQSEDRLGSNTGREDAALEDVTGSLMKKAQHDDFNAAADLLWGNGGAL